MRDLFTNDLAAAPAKAHCDSLANLLIQPEELNSLDQLFFTARCLIYGVAHSIQRWYGN